MAEKKKDKIMPRRKKHYTIFRYWFIVITAHAMMFAGGFAILQEIEKRFVKGDSLKSYALGLALTGAKQRLIKCIR